MIDNIKLFVLDKHRLENQIINNGLVELSTTLNYFTGEVEEYPKRGKDSNLNVTITLHSATLLGSIHKYKNIMEGKGDQNHNDFNFDEIQDVIRGLIKKYHIEKDTKITNLEFGFNLEVSKDPQLILDNNVLMNNYIAPNKNLKFSGRGDYKEFQLTDYRIKIYNKSKQYKLKTNLLRIELKIINKRLLQKLKINCLEDVMDKEVINRLFKLFMERFEGLCIVDFFDTGKVPQNDCDKLNKYTNPNYWIRIKSEISPKRISALKRDFNYLLNKYELLKMKKAIREKLNSKFIELINNNNPEYRNVA
ncbi:hypothetical protein [Flavobacterium sp. GT3R68]|uniref:hypothetical protein n=1 Tax=Flavobacterium sp. GT3R68 TaxID=2594437 RepID=UPI000F88B95B|nr:hypothetical protein [Flavobacterium sp. GT3R68]RTY89636.1 hypothetical protein EKL32_22170 [Flavobacterium sp. GSN2]TRW89477.1 hypothetical protein FNW07_13340 [Flavobacterium sp. GT3R68]